MPLCARCRWEPGPAVGRQRRALSPGSQGSSSSRSAETAGLSKAGVETKYVFQKASKKTELSGSTEM